MGKVYIVEGARTAFCEFGQSFLKTSTTELGTVSAVESLKRSKIKPEQVGHVVYGNVIHSSTNAAYLARHIALYTGIPVTTPAMIVNRLCGSGMQAVVSAAQTILLGETDIVLAGGVENMTQSPHADFISRFIGKKLGAVELKDTLMSTLTDEFIGYGMGMTAENLAERYRITREEQDAFALLSHKRAACAREKLADEMIEVKITSRSDTMIIRRDQHVKENTSNQDLAKLHNSFKKDGTVTAGNSSGINDGAVSLVVAGEKSIQDRQPLARIVSWGISGVEPSLMGLGPVSASLAALKRANLSLHNIDLVEINEAFAAQYLAVEKELGLDRNKTNVNGGAIALGHPLGASGARLLLTLAYELKRQNKCYGLAALCIGGGQGIAMVIANECRD